MEQRIKRNTALINLVSNFETNFEKGNIQYLNEKTFYQLINYYEAEEDFEKALDVSYLALEQYKYRSDFYICTSRILLKINAIEECLECIQQAEMITPYETEIMMLKVKALALQGEYERAFDELDSLKALALKGDIVDIHICEAEIYAEMSYYDKMFGTLKDALLLEPRNVEAIELFWKSTELSKKYIESMDFLRKLIDKDPYSAMAWFYLSHGLAFKGEYTEAIDAMEYAYLINPDLEAGYLECADLCCQTKDFDRALEIFEEAKDRFGEDVDLLIRIGECQMYLNDTKSSKANLYKAIKQDPYNDEPFYFLAECFSKEEKWFSAINAYHKAIEIEDNCGEYYLGLARAYVAVEDYNKATVNFHLAVSDGPDQTHFWREFASFLFKMGLYEESIQILDEAEDCSFGADLLYVRALSNFFLKDKKEGLYNLEEALKEDFSLHTMIYNLAPELEVDKEIRSMISYFAGE